ncbi:MAG: DUF3572 domain-containing protein [Alphaproteobacteria bacterium]|nr:DUF3572 domain-containing protein [Alphaproteobacteria bacterium]
MKRPLYTQNPSKEEAEIYGIKALQFIAEDSNLLNSFINSTGFIPSDLQDRIDHPLTIAALFDFLLSEEEVLKKFLHIHNIDIKFFIKCRQYFPGFSGW